MAHTLKSPAKEGLGLAKTWRSAAVGRSDGLVELLGRTRQPKQSDFAIGEESHDLVVARKAVLNF